MFLNPWLLVGLSAVSVPIIIHLLNRRKFDRVAWAAMRFVAASLEKNRRRMQIEDLLLLALRCLVVALLALALARPTLTKGAGLFGRSPVTAMVLLDNSYSMGKNDGAATRFELAKKAADELVAALPDGSSAAVLLVSDVVRDVIPQPTVDLNLARQKIAQAGLSDRGTDLLPGLQQAFRTLAAASGGEKEVVLFTDGQASSWRQANRAAEIRKLFDEHKSDIAGHIVLVGDQETRNLAVSNIRMATELPTVNKSLRFEVEVSNFGPVEVRDVPVRLFVDDGAAPVEEAVIDAIPARGAKSVALHARLRTDGFHGITARIPPDALPADDARSMAVRILKQVQVLLVDGEAGREGREEDVFFLREALQPVPADMREQYFVQTRTIPASQLGNVSFDSYDAVVLANVADLTRPTVAAMERFLNQGGGVIVFPGPNTNIGFYNDVLAKERRILPAELGPAKGDSGQGERFETLQSERFEHPITAFWNEEGRGNLAAAHFFRMFDLLPAGGAASQPGDPKPDPTISAGPAAIVARYANGNVAIVEHTWGAGRVVLFGSTANTQWNDLPVRAPIFVPLMYRVLDSLLSRQDENLNIQVGQKFVLRVPGEVLGKDVQILRPGAPGGVPDMARVEMVGDWPAVTYDQTEVGGIYHATIEGLPQGPIAFAVQPNTAESDLVTATKEELTAVTGSEYVAAWQPGMAQRQSVAATQSGRELWRVFAMAVFILALMETGLAFWFSRPK